MNHSKETNAGQVGPDKHLQISLNDIERKATYCKNHKFENLYSLLNKWNLSESWNYINKRAARGIDKVSAKEFEKNLAEEVTALEKELKDNAYHANLVRRTYIDKPNGDKRPLGIPTVKDKLLQTTCSKILEAIYEPKFYDTRYGYRKGKGTKDAVKHLGKDLNFGRHGYIVEADIKGYFQKINHDILIEMLEHDIKDKRFINLIKKWLKAGIMNKDNVVEKRFEKFGLELAKEKTYLIKFSRFSKDRNGNFDFLGFTYNWRVSRNVKDIIVRTTSKKKFKTSISKIKQWIKANRNLRLRKLIDLLNIKLKGYYNYYGLVGNSEMLSKMDIIVKKLLYKWMNRRSQRRCFNWIEFNDKLKRNYPIQKPFIESLNVQMKIQYVV